MESKIISVNMIVFNYVGILMNQLRQDYLLHLMQIQMQLQNYPNMGMTYKQWY